MATPEHFQKNPIFGTDLSKPISVILTEMRKSILTARGNIIDIKNAGSATGERIEYLEGYFTTGIKSLYDEINECRKYETKFLDVKLGKSIKFNSRGIGLDTCPGCFICGGESNMMSNISAFVDSKEDGEEIVSWFEQGTILDYREHEPSWIQVKIGACKKHETSLKVLDLYSSEYDVIRKSEVLEIIKQANINN